LTASSSSSGRESSSASAQSLHPSSILRGEPSDRERAFEAFVDDLEVVAGYL